MDEGMDEGMEKGTNKLRAREGCEEKKIKRTFKEMKKKVADHEFRKGRDEEGNESGGEWQKN